MDAEQLKAANNAAWISAVDLGEIQPALQAAEVIRTAFASKRLPVDFVDTLAEVYRRAGQAEVAKTLVNAALAEDESSAILHFQSGMLLAEATSNQRQLEVAQRSLEKSLTLGLSQERTAEARQKIESFKTVALPKD
ncbi:MAG: hypothetical protein O3A00_13160 [Planctomycetota bacterium]|nr:hypothetical protein [Planctomycetota bacterium]